MSRPRFQKHFLMACTGKWCISEQSVECSIDDYPGSTLYAIWRLNMVEIIKILVIFKDYIANSYFSMLVLWALDSLEPSHWIFMTNKVMEAELKLMDLLKFWASELQWKGIFRVFSPHLCRRIIMCVIFCFKISVCLLDCIFSQVRI